MPAHAEKTTGVPFKGSDRFVPTLDDFVTRAAQGGHVTFFGEHGDRLNVPLSWREGAISEEKWSLIITQPRADLLGEPLL